MISNLDIFQPASSSSQGQPLDTLDKSHGSELRSPVVSSAMLAIPTSALVVPHGTIGAAELPIADVREYLKNRAPLPKWEMEPRLFYRLPLDLRGSVRRLQAAVILVFNLSAGKGAIKVQPACRRALAIYTEFGPLNTFRGKYDLWLKQQDWLVLVNRAKAGAAWQATQRGLPEAFLDYVAARMGEFKRGDAAEQAILSIQRQWSTGRTHKGLEEVMPGYEQNWEQRSRALLPVGWHSTNIRAQLKKRAKFTKPVKALLHEGIHAAKEFLPHVHGTRQDLRFMELVQFDDVRCDFRVMDTDSGQVNDLWLLIARDVATGMLLGFGMRPARARDDGTQEHLKLQDMKQLAGWLLETYGLPPYLMTWKIERGTATLAQGTANALTEMIGPDRIHVSYSSMITGDSPLGYAEKAIGNSKAKAMLESLNRMQHLLTSHFPGQIGLNYSKRPAEIAARETEAVEIWRGHRPEDRAELRYPFYTIPQAREGLLEIFGIQNRRDTHDMEGFRKIAEWFDGLNWQPANTAPQDMAGIQTRTRMESPIERAAWLLAGCEPFTKVSPEILIAFYEHTQRTVTVLNSGEIQMMVEGKTLRFAPPAPEFALVADRKVLGYFNPNDPRFLTLTDGRGGILGTWLRTGLVKHGDRDALAAAIRYSTSALKVAKSRATDLAAGEQASLHSMREHNAGFVTVVEPKASGRDVVTSPVAAHQIAVAGEKAVTKKKQQSRDADRRVAREALRNLSA